MIEIFHGTDAKTHRAFQSWRRANVDGFHMTESKPGQFVVHYTQNRPENSLGRGCMHPRWEWCEIPPGQGQLLHHGT